MSKNVVVTCFTILARYLAEDGEKLEDPDHNQSRI
jgi:hypothetical protein